jgi:hypothetical protein
MRSDGRSGSSHREQVRTAHDGNASQASVDMGAEGARGRPSGEPNTAGANAVAGTTMPPRRRGSREPEAWDSRWGARADTAAPSASRPLTVGERANDPAPSRTARHGDHADKIDAKRGSEPGGTAAVDDGNERHRRRDFRIEWGQGDERGAEVQNRPSGRRDQRQAPRGEDQEERV